MLAQGLSVERIARRFAKDPSTVAYWLKKHGLEAPNRERHAAKGGIARERLEALVAAGMSISQLADELVLSKTTVRYWLRRYGLSTDRTRRIEAGRAAKNGGVAVLKRPCPSHGETDFVIEGSGYYRCKRCRMERVAERRRTIKALLVAEAGGRCCVCGYNGYVGALEFHHVDRDEKRLEINCAGAALAIATLRAEARKCVLLCSNCHAEVEGGVTPLPARVLERSQA
jgi:transposase